MYRVMMTNMRMHDGRSDVPPTDAGARAEAGGRQTSNQRVATRQVNRQARGERRRRNILEAALRVIGREGVAGVTHRAVAAEAGVPLASTTYYFESKADLLREAFRHHCGRGVHRAEMAALDALESSGGQVPGRHDAVDAMMGFLLHELSRGPDQMVAEYELHLEASRRPELRELSRQSYDELTGRLGDWMAKLGSPAPSRDAFLIVMAMIGIELETLSRGADTFATDDVRTSLDRLVRALLSTPEGARED